ncbi:hypothetical protein LIS82_13780 [Cytobacillus solani]|uniref:Uncharacterized protein n=1 Tax=Cytobacillus solani TaxID=1637975 RepID=A0A0Q3VH63_9BACI|nr:hypothetical protein [Cytobacillus solani]KOP82481.1 hypothetical protein AMS60_08315 [Bacillus sp. FJAT-21945]KQL19490.1 hypothetical protein AN957_13585 [Cytobacillus solani]USK52712.1 hypothetical protein LIS82_13780 [Cytobacillus solani]
MKLEITFQNNVIEYILNKIAALGLLIFIMCIYLISRTGFDLNEFTEYLSNIKIWGLICGYALVMTMLIDLVKHKWIDFTLKTSILLHCLAGFIVFFPFMGIHLFSLIAGSVGALCAFIYSISYYFIKKKNHFVWIVLLVFPLLLSIRLVDFTIKEEWTEEKTKSSFSAEFERFNGKHEIPLPLEKGDIVTIYISFDQINEGGYGYHISDNYGDLVGIKELEKTYKEYGDIDTKPIQFEAKKTSVYKLIVTGDNLKGKIDVKWKID